MNVVGRKIGTLENICHFRSFSNNVRTPKQRYCYHGKLPFGDGTLREFFSGSRHKPVSPVKSQPAVIIDP